MTVDQEGHTEASQGPVQQAFEGGMVGLVEIVDPLQRFLHRQALGVDFLAVADHASDRAEATRDPNRARVDIGR